MWRTANRLIILALTLGGLLSPHLALATSSAGGYSIEHFDVSIQVNENNTYAVMETIDVDFSEPRHGIYRLLPRQQHLYRLDGTRSNSRVQITQIDANTSYTTSNEGNQVKIRLGDADRTIVGPATFVIEYLYNAGADQLKDNDEFYYNLIGEGWDVDMGAVTFDVTFPKDFDPSSLGFSVGKYGTVDPDRVEASVSGRTITGSVLGGIDAGEAVTMRLTLPEGYYVGAGFAFNWWIGSIFVVTLICLAVAYSWWRRYGRDDPVVETVEFYPPEGLNSAEIGYLYNGTLSNDAKISLLLYLAEHGYLKIIDTGKSGKTKSFEIEKVKDYDGNNAAEQEFFRGLFNGRDRVTGSSLENTFYKTLAKVDSIITENKKNVWWDKKADSKQWHTLFLALFSLAVTFLGPLVQNGGDLDFLFSGSFILFLILLAFHQSLFSKAQQTLFIILAGVIAFIWTSSVAPSLIYEPTALLLNGLSLAASIGVIFFYQIMGKMTPAAVMLQGRIRGLRRFLQTAEKSKLEALVAENPQYFYNILPYTYALGVSSVWVDQFRKLAIQPPDWYESANAYDAARFAHFLNSTMDNVKSTMVSAPSSSGSGSGHSSGGGFSGGGGGGGGGGSW